MIVHFPYDRDEISLPLPEGRFHVIEPSRPSLAHSFESELGNALANPIQAPPLQDFLNGRKRVLLVVPDASRQVGAGHVLPVLAQELERAGIGPEMVTLGVATGIHRAPTDEEMDRLTGGNLFAGSTRFAPITCNTSDFVLAGTTTFGNRLLLHRALFDADAVLLVGGVGFHYFAGFGGGRKLVLPGLAHRSSITFNHNLVFAPEGGRHPGVGTARLEGNPVHEDMVQALEAVGLERLFALTTLPGAGGNPTGVLAGHALESHREACRRYEEAHTTEVTDPVDLVVASAGGFPRDINMIQAHKTIEMARLGLRPGGTLVVFAACREGMGNPEFFPWFRFQSEAEFESELKARYIVNGQTALALFQKACRYRIILVSHLDPADVARMGLIPARSPAEALSVALRDLPADWRGLVLPEASATFVRCTQPDIRRIH